MWYDAHALDVLRALRDQFDVRAFVETGTHLGIGTRVWAKLFQQVYSCDIDDGFLAKAEHRCISAPNAFLFRSSSPDFLGILRRGYVAGHRTDTPIIYLDAHWGEYWPILDELRALAGCHNCIIIIHDFKVEGMGYDTYGGIELDLALVRDGLRAVNPDFKLFTNSRDLALPMPQEDWLKRFGGWGDVEIEGTLSNALSIDWNKYRGTLYALPREPGNSTLLVGVI